MKITHTLALTAFMIVQIEMAHAQGCSDAGVCTMGALDGKANSAEEQLGEKFGIKFTQSVGIGEQATLHSLSIPEINYSLDQDFRLQLRLPVAYNFGNLGNTIGVSDISLSGSYKVFQEDHQALSVTVGVRIPTNTSDLQKNGRLLPMPYQTSLGTLDGIIGLSYARGPWSIVAGYQDVLLHFNDNQFSHQLWSDNQDAQKYFESNLFRRSNDAILRVERAFDIRNNQWKLSPSILGIYRIGYDSLVDTTGNRVDIQGSKGLTLNANINLSANSGSLQKWNFLLAAPFVVRSVRPDGLTRALILAVSYQIR